MLGSLPVAGKEGKFRGIQFSEAPDYGMGGIFPALRSWLLWRNFSFILMEPSSSKEDHWVQNTMSTVFLGTSRGPR